MTTYDRAIEQARDLLRWRSPLRTELWAARLVSEGDPDLLGELAGSERPEARLATAALATLELPDDLITTASATPYDAEAVQEIPTSDEERDDLTAAAREDEERDDLTATVPRTPPPYGVDLAVAGREALEWLPRWAARMGEVVCEGAWYGRGDRHGEQVLAALAFRYADGREPHLLVVGIDQAHGGLAVDAVVEEPKFLDDLDLARAPADVVAGRVLDAFEVTDLLMGAEVADTLPAVRPLALARARSVPDPVRHAPDETFTAFDALPDTPGADEAFGALAEFVGARPLWWSPARVSVFLTSWLPREAILSDAAIAAMPEVLRAWTRHLGDHEEIHDRIAAEAPRLPALMADESLAGLAKRIAASRTDEPGADPPAGGGYGVQ
ncbi:hypothetical protein [Nonomuraea harbinensis]|uniref:Uncharacterized protein n=1 Tax=Nonomuraea harbinensis TaxID=1286938 RepID=A0ABW1BSU6_9ACTN|nr:hypothetical protein [Nonomuraea harbinensis]